jgi:hypothetical protein
MNNVEKCDSRNANSSYFRELDIAPAPPGIGPYQLIPENIWGVYAQAAVGLVNSCPVVDAPNQKSYLGSHPLKFDLTKTLFG